MITSTSNQRVKQLVAWNQKSRERKKDGVFLAEGIKMFLEAPLDLIKEVYISETMESKILSQEDEVSQKLKETTYEILSDDVFRKAADTQTPQGILCVLKQPGYSAEELLKGEPPLLLILEDLQDPGNLGTILRTAEGAGVTGVFMNKKTVDIYNPKTIRATMGAIYRVPFLYIEEIPTLLEELRKRGITSYAAHLSDSRWYDEPDYTCGCAFLIGNEGNGLKEETAKLADSYVKIPMDGQVESLNAAVAASLLIYEASRQRRRR